MNTWLQSERIYQPLATTFGLCGPLDLSPSEAVIGTAILSISTRKIDIKIPHIKTVKRNYKSQVNTVLVLFSVLMHAFNSLPSE